MEDKFWKRKLSAYLHDTPSKALDIRSHEDRAAGAAARAGVDGEFKKSADHLAASADRIPFPDYRTSHLSCSFNGVDNQFHHPLGGDAFYRFSETFTSTGQAEECEQVVQPGQLAKSDIEGATAQRADFFAHWRLWPDWLAEKDARCMFLPADTRIPDHTIFNHCSVTAAFAGVENDAPALLRFHIGPVQSFIAAARSTRDLWSGSFLISWLITAGLKKLSECVGPDAVIFPNLHGQPLFDFLWRGDLWDKMKSHARSDKSIWEVLSWEPEAVLTPNFPNTFLALVPQSQAEELARAVEAAIRTEWNDIANASWEFAVKETDKDNRERFDRQVARHLTVSWQVTPFPKTLDDAEKIVSGTLADTKILEASSENPELCVTLPRQNAHLPNVNSAFVSVASLDFGVFGGCLERFRAVRKTFENDIPQNHRDGRYYTNNDKTRLNNVGLAWSLIVALSAWQLDAVRQTRAFSGWSIGSGKKENRGRIKDALNNREEALFWKETMPLLTDEARSEFKHEDDPVGATTLIKRVWHRAWIMRKFDYFKPGDFAMPNTREIALNTDWDNKKDEAKYFAVIAFDGDDMGKWVSGEKSPQFGSQLADYTENGERKGSKIYFEKNAAAILETPRPVTPSYHLQFSQALSNFAIHIVPRIVKAHGGRLIYAGGDDVLAMLPATAAIDCADDLQRAFSGRPPKKECGITEISPGFLSVKKDQNKNCIPLLVPGPAASASCGIAMAHFKAPLQDVVREAQAAEKRAKKHFKKQGEKNAFAVSVFKHSGEISQWAASFKADKAAFSAYTWIMHAMEEDVVSAKFPHRLLEFIAPYRSSHDMEDAPDFDFTQAVMCDLDTALERQRGTNYNTDEGRETLKRLRDAVSGYLKNLTGATTEKYDQLAGLLTVAAFLARQPQEKR